MEHKQLKENVDNLVQTCHNAAYKSGWWNFNGLDVRNIIAKPTTEYDKFVGNALVGQKLMLIVSEAAEAMEGHRKGRMDDHLPNRPMIEVELADVVIRVADLCGAMGLDLGGAITEKLAYNANRPDHKPENRQAVGGKSY